MSKSHYQKGFYDVTKENGDVIRIKLNKNEAKFMYERLMYLGFLKKIEFFIGLLK